eukprot:COSAG06_NODE_1317_length_9885_cov_44.166820_6_plen_89_part_00
MQTRHGSGALTQVAQPTPGSVKVGKRSMSDDEFYLEWSVPDEMLSVPTDTLAPAVVAAWQQFFALLDEGQAADNGSDGPLQNGDGAKL